MNSVFDSTAIPRYVQLSDIIRQRIAAGDWAPGDMLPSLRALMAEFDVSRVTVRQAMQLLAREGLLSPQRGRGTFVTAEAGRQRRLQVKTTLADLVEMYRGDTPDLSNIVEGVATPDLTEADGKPAPKYFYMRRVHARDGERYCVISIYIDHRVFRRAPKRLRREVVLPILTSLPGVEIAAARQTLRISKADVDVARQLHIPVNTPVGEVRRVLNGPDGTVIYLGEVTYRGDYVHLEMDLKP
jgi:GntR family transcriptional regulator